MSGSNIFLYPIGLFLTRAVEQDRSGSLHLSGSGYHHFLFRRCVCGDWKYQGACSDRCHSDIQLSAGAAGYFLHTADAGHDSGGYHGNELRNQYDEL